MTVFSPELGGGKFQSPCHVEGNVEHPEEGGEVEVVHGDRQEEAGHVVEVPGEHVGQEGAVGADERDREGGEVLAGEILQLRSDEGDDKVEKEADKGDAQAGKSHVAHDW